MKNDSQALRPLFQLDPEITFLNHGSYGACPIPVFEDYQKWQEKMAKIHNVAEVLVAKQRHGPIGKVNLHFEGSTTKFSNLSKSQSQIVDSKE